MTKHNPASEGSFDYDETWLGYDEFDSFVADADDDFLRFNNEGFKKFFGWRKSKVCEFRDRDTEPNVVLRLVLTSGRNPHYEEIICSLNPLRHSDLNATTFGNVVLHGNGEEYWLKHLAVLVGSGDITEGAKQIVPFAILQAAKPRAQGFEVRHDLRSSVSAPTALAPRYEQFVEVGGVTSEGEIHVPTFVIKGRARCHDGLIESVSGIGDNSVYFTVQNDGDFRYSDFVEGISLIIYLSELGCLCAVREGFDLGIEVAQTLFGFVQQAENATK